MKSVNVILVDLVVRYGKGPHYLVWIYGERDCLVVGGVSVLLEIVVSCSFVGSEPRQIDPIDKNGRLGKSNGHQSLKVAVDGCQESLERVISSALERPLDDGSGHVLFKVELVCAAVAERKFEREVFVCRNDSSVSVHSENQGALTEEAGGDGEFGEAKLPLSRFSILQLLRDKRSRNRHLERALADRNRLVKVPVNRLEKGRGRRGRVRGGRRVRSVAGVRHLRSKGEERDGPR